MNVLEEMSREHLETLEAYMRTNNALERKEKDLEALMNCVKNLGDIERSVDALSERLVDEIGLDTLTDVKYICIGKDFTKDPAAAPAGWYRKESGKHPGKFYYVNEKTGATSWKMPQAEPSSPEPIMIPLAKEGFRAPPGLVAPAKVVCPPPGFAAKTTCKMMDDPADYSTDAGLTDGGAYSTDYDSDFARPVNFRSSHGYSTKTQISADCDKTVFNACAPVFQPQRA